MKKILSVFLAILIMVTSCVCALNVFAAEPCVDHVVELWKNNENNTKNHVGVCTVCGETVKEAHILVKGETEAPTCTVDGYTHYTCKCGYSEDLDIVRKTGHNIVSTTYNYDVNGDGVFNDLDVKYEKTSKCTHKYIDENGIERDCPGEKTTGNIGNSNYCTACGKYTLLSKTLVNATCRTVDYVIYHCSNSECESEYSISGKELLDCNYELKVKEATCEEEGYNLYTCTMCGDSYKDTYLPKKPHKFNMIVAEEDAVKYTYKNGACEIIGYCSLCKKSQRQVEQFATPEKCVSCGKAINDKTVIYPANCEDSIKIKTNCNSCATQEIEALPVGHNAVTTTYEYHDNGTIKSVTVDCANGCDGKSNSNEYDNANTCVICSSIIEKRVVIAPTCETNGYTKVTCPECGVYTESTKNTIAHNSTVAEWSFDRASGTYIFKADCTNNGCGGYTYSAAIGTAGRCARCGKDTLKYKKVESSDCTFSGYTNAECTYCGNYEGYDVKTSLAHKTISTSVEPTCTKGGVTKSTCVNCYYTVETNETAPLGHLGDVASIKYDSATKTKTTTGWCYRCEKTYTTEPEAYNEVENDCAKGHTDGITSRVVIKPDCKSGTSGYTRIYCSTCVYYDVDIIPATHDFGEWTVIYEPTCVETGLRARTCENCSSIEEDTIAPNQTTTGDPKHKYVVVVKGTEPTCTKPGLSDEMYCGSCGDYQKAVVLEPLNHKDDDGDPDYCDLCDSYLIGEGDGTVTCSCMCHNKDGLAKFFFKFILFFK